MSRNYQNHPELYPSVTARDPHYFFTSSGTHRAPKRFAPDLDVDEPLDTDIDPDDALAFYLKRAELADLEYDLRPNRWCTLQPD